MGFFERNRRQLADRGIDPDRLPPGQYFTERFPVLHVGDVPQIEVATWTLRVFGLVDRELTISWDELRAMPPTSLHTDIHCVTKWSKFDTSWTGVAVRDLFDRAGLRPEATHVMGHAAYGYTANLPLADVVRPESMVAYGYDGGPIPAEHGGPVRLVVPHLYFWKSPKWLEGLEVRAADEPGFWERNGYHMYGDPWREQRYWGD
jgi:DMSO/TMAO reductase YedYZ molybdopterin-dependent catalytic subunit